MNKQQRDFALARFDFLSNITGYFLLSDEPDWINEPTKRQLIGYEISQNLSKDAPDKNEYWMQTIQSSMWVRANLNKVCTLEEMIDDLFEDIK